MAQNNSDTSFLQPIFSTFGLIASVLSAVAPLFAQAQLSGFFVTPELSLPASVVSVVLGVLFSWHLITIHGMINLPIGIKKQRGRGYEEAWKSITDRNVVPLIIILCLIIFIVFFVVKGLESSYLLGALQATCYVAFFTLLIGSFSLLFVITKGTHDWQQQIANTGSIVYETLERNGVIRSGVQIVQNADVSNQDELFERGFGQNDTFAMKRLIVKTGEQKPQTFRVYMSSDYSQLKGAFLVPEDEAQDTKLPAN